MDHPLKAFLFEAMYLLLWLGILCGLVHCVKDVTITSVTAVAGEPVYLPCDISTLEDDHAVLVLWYREDIGTPIYSVDGRDRDFSQAERWSDDAAFGSRAYFMAERVPAAELGVDHVRSTDEGVYRCRVDFLKAQTRNSKVNLTVLVPPQKITIFDEFGVERTSVVGPYAEGDSLLLHCDVFGGSPPPKVTWYRNGIATLTPSQALPGGGQPHARSELSVGSLSRSDLHSELTCKANNNNRTQPLAATVHLDMNFGPLDVRILGANQPLSAGRRYDLLCQSAGSRPPAQLTWWRNGQRLDKTKETTSNDGNQTTSTLSFVASKSDAGKYLSCRSQNPVVSEEPLEDGWRLEIQYLPEARVQLGTSLNPDTIREGTDVYFDCIINAHPPVYKVEWRHNGKALQQHVAGGVIVSNHSLVLQGVSRSTAGNYTCVGKNAEGDAESPPLTLNVLFAPTCAPQQTRVHGVAKAERAQVQCVVEANPPEVTFRWTFNNSAESIDVAASHVARAGTSSQVSYTPMTELDYGTLLCWATNKIGRQRVPCVYHIIAAGRPDQVHNCTITNISMTSFTIRCTEGFNGGLPQSFLLEVRESSTQDLKANFSSPIPRFAAAGLVPGNHYLVGVYSYNAKGRSEPVVLQAATLRLPEKQLTAENEQRRTMFALTPLLSASIGLVCALLIISLVSVVILRVQCRRRRPDDLLGKAKGVANRSNASRTGRESPNTSDKSADGRTDGGKDAVVGDGNESDEKNPDVIPDTADSDDQLEFTRRRQHISTIESPHSGSPPLSRVPAGGRSLGGSVLGPGPGAYALVRPNMAAYPSHLPPMAGGYCTIQRNNGAPGNAATAMHTPMSYSQCTLPRHMWPSYGGGVAGVSPAQMGGVMSCPAPAIPMHTLNRASTNRPHQTYDQTKEKLPGLMSSLAEEEATAETPLMVAKRESTV